MLTRIRLKNFKAFKDTGDLRIAPVTVLTGPNGSGKSAIIRAMMALRQTVESRDLQTAFVPTGPYVDLGPYEDMVLDHDLTARVGIEVDAQVAPTGKDFLGLIRVELEPGHDTLDLSLSLNFAYLKSIDRIYLKHSDVTLDGEDLQVHKQSMGSSRLGRSYSATVKYKDEQAERLANSSIAQFHVAPPLQLTEASLSTSSKRRSRISPTQGRKILATQFAKITEATISEELTSLRYIGPLRAKPERIYPATGQTPTEVGAAGESGPAFLWSASEAKQFDLVKLSDWCARMGLAWKVKLLPSPGGFFRLMLVDAHTGVTINITDAGFGTSQLLPILIQGLVTPEGGTLLLEQPEIHLHPKAQADLADFLVEVSQRGVGVIVETHSEHLLTRLQRRIAEATLGADKVALYYVIRSDDGSVVTQVKINEYGQVPNAPEGFFAEGVAEAFQILTVVGQRKAEEAQAQVSG